VLLYCQSAHAIDYSCVWPPDQLFHFLFVFKRSAIAIPITRTLFIFTFCGVCRVGGNHLTGDRSLEEGFSCFAGDQQVIKAKKGNTDQRQQYNDLQFYARWNMWVAIK